DLKRHHVQVLVLGGEESSQQRERTLRSLDESGFGGCANLRIPGLQAIGPVTNESRARGETRWRPRRRWLRRCDRVPEAGHQHHGESESHHQWTPLHAASKSAYAAHRNVTTAWWMNNPDWNGMPC